MVVKAPWGNPTQPCRTHSALKTHPTLDTTLQLPQRQPSPTQPNPTQPNSAILIRPPALNTNTCVVLPYYTVHETHHPLDHTGVSGGVESERESRSESHDSYNAAASPCAAVCAP